jgi:hypothetical protein
VIIKAKVAALEEVTVPAGTFQALRVEYDITIDGETVATITHWFGANVGLLKQIVEGAEGQQLLIELERYQPSR